MSISMDMHNTADFIISADVLEHTPPPVETAFGNLFKILKPGGVCILSVPYRNIGESEEHFPGLYNYSIVKRDGKKVLVSKDREGCVRVFENLHFHLGLGAVLEMRMFSKKALQDVIEKTGFNKVIFYQDSIPEHGILLESDTDSVVIVLRKE